MILDSHRNLSIWTSSPGSPGENERKTNCLYRRITMPKILHFADSHIDMANYGRQDPETGLPLRVMDFLK